MIFQDAILEFGFDCKVRKLSPRSIDNYQKQLRYLQNYVFLSNRGKKLTQEAIAKFFKRASAEVKINSQVRVSPHTCRHTFAHLQLKNGLDLYSLSRLMGHESVAITQRYLEGIKDDEVLKKGQRCGVLPEKRGAHPGEPNNKGQEHETAQDKDTCRHTFAHLQLKNGLDLYSLSRLMGHESVAITQRYLEGIKDDEVLKKGQRCGVLQNL